MLYLVKMNKLYLCKIATRLSVLVASATLVIIAPLMLIGSVYAIARGYNTNDQGLQTGMVVALSLDNNSSAPSVERANQDSGQRVVGIVTTNEESLVTVGSSASKVLVESEGQVDGYVSDINGKVQKGDQLVLSPLKGVLMKGVTGTPGTIVAIAADTVTATSSYPYVDNGKTLKTDIGKIKVNLNHTGVQNNGSSSSDSPLARIGRAVTGKEVGEVRVLIAMIIFIIVLIAEGSILYGAISSAVTALGRNPLARKIIRGELFRVILVALVVLGVGLGAVYGILWV